VKILHIITSLKIGGAESALYNLLCKMMLNKNEEHQVVYFYNGPTNGKIQELRIKTHCIKGFVCMYDIGSLVKLNKIIKSYSPDILHSSLWSANIIGRIMGKKFGIPVICELHDQFFMDSNIRCWLECKTSNLSNKIIAVADGIKQSYITNITRKVGTKTLSQILHKIMVIKNGIDAIDLVTKATIKPLDKEAIGFKNSDFVVGAVGRLEPIKSFDLLIKSFYIALQTIDVKTGKNLKLCIVGGGPEFDKLKKMISKLNLENNVSLAGPRNDACRFYPIFDCFAISSQTEGLSIALLEALSFGLPIITTNDGSKHDVISNGIHGLIVPKNNPDALSKAILQVFQNQQLIDKMRIENIKLINSSFNINSVAKQYEKLYNEISS
jgi:glycosyltransferase involved in cell wall biosynthesis